MSKTIYAHCGGEITVSDEDYESLSKFNWYLYKSKQKSPAYAVTSIRRKTIRMHRLVMDAPLGAVVDHINGDSADNRRENLRFVTRSHNSLNSKTKPRSLPRNIYQHRKQFVVQFVRGDIKVVKKAFRTLDAAIGFRNAQPEYAELISVNSRAIAAEAEWLKAYEEWKKS